MFRNELSSRYILVYRHEQHNPDLDLDMDPDPDPSKFIQVNGHKAISKFKMDLILDLYPKFSCGSSEYSGQFSSLQIYLNDRHPIKYWLSYTELVDILISICQLYS